MAHDPIVPNPAPRGRTPCSIAERFRAPAVLFLLALAVRLIPVLLSRNLGIGLDDMFQYDMLGRSLAEGAGYRWYAEPDLDLIRRYIEIDISGMAYDPRGVETTFRAPLYPIFLAVVYAAVGPASFARFFAVRLAQAVMGALLSPMTFALARRMDPDRPAAARLAGMVVALYPLLVLFPLGLGTENPFFALSLWCLLLLLRGAESKRLAAFAAAGAVLGLALLTRSVLAFFAPLAAWWIWRKAAGARAALVFLAAAAALVFPWVLRNSFVAGRPSGVESSMGYNLYLGYHPDGNGSFQVGISFDLLTILDDGERDRVGTARALEFMRADPGRVPVLISQKAMHFFGLERRILTYFYSNNFFGYLPPPALWSAALLFLAPFALMAPLSFFGAAAAPRTGARLLGGLFFGAYLAPHLLIMAEERFHLALVPLMAVWAAVAWVRRRDILDSLQRPGGWRNWALPALLSMLLIAGWAAGLTADAPKLAQLFGPDGNTAGFAY